MSGGQTERYIYNRLCRFDPAYRLYGEDVLQEVAVAVFLSGDEREAFRTASRNCQKLLRQFGHRRSGIRARYEAHVLYHHKLAQSQGVFE